MSSRPDFLKDILHEPSSPEAKRLDAHHTRALMRAKYQQGSWAKLAEAVPSSEKAWRTKRRRYGIESCANASASVQKLFGRSLGGLHDWVQTLIRVLVYIVLFDAEPGRAARYVDQHRILGDLSRETLAKYVRWVKRLVRMVEVVYSRGLGSRIFELMFFFASYLRFTDLSAITADRHKFVSLFRDCPRLEDSHSWAMPDFICVIRHHLPEYSVQRIEVLLGLNSHCDKPFGSIPTTIFRPRQILNSFTMTFELNNELRKTGHLLHGCAPMPNTGAGGAVGWGYKWEPGYESLLYIALAVLKDEGFLKVQPRVSATMRALHHDAGPVHAPDGMFQIVLPLRPRLNIPLVQGPWGVYGYSYENSRQDDPVEETTSIRGSGWDQQWIEWNHKCMYIVRSGQTFVASRTIDFISMVISVDSTTV